MKNKIQTYDLLFTPQDFNNIKDDEFFNACYVLTDFLINYETTASFVSWMKQPTLKALSAFNKTIIQQYFKIYDKNLNLAYTLENNSKIHANIDEILKEQVKTCSELVDNTLILYTIELIKHNFVDFYNQHKISFETLIYQHKVDDQLEALWIGTMRNGYRIDSLHNHLYYQEIIHYSNEELLAILDQTKTTINELSRLNLKGEKLIKEINLNKIQTITELKNFINPENEWELSLEEIKLLDCFYAVFTYNYKKKL